MLCLGWLSLLCLCAMIIPAHADETSDIYDAPAPDSTFYVRLFNKEKKTVFSYGYQPTTTLEQSIFPAGDASQVAPLRVHGIKVIRAEGMQVLNFYRNLDDKEPVVSVSFGVDIHEPVYIDSIWGDTNVRNVQVRMLGLSGENDQDESISRIVLSRPYNFVIL